MSVRHEVGLADLLRAATALGQSYPLAELAATIGLELRPARRPGGDGIAATPAPPESASTAAPAWSTDQIRQYFAQEVGRTPPPSDIPFTIEHELPDGLPAEKRATSPLPPDPEPRSLRRLSLFAPRLRRDILRRSLSRSIPASEIDIAELTRRLSRLQPLRRLPRRSRPSLRHGVQLLIDVGSSTAPFWQDQQGLVASIRRLLGPAAVDVVHVEGAPDPKSGVDGYTLPVSGRPVLIVSDLGIARSPKLRGSKPKDWARFIGWLQARQLQVTAYIPFAVGRHSAAWRGLLPVHVWDRPGVGARVGFDSETLRRDLGLRAPLRRETLELATRLSMAARIEPDLVREMRLRLTPWLPAATEADLWFGPLVRSANQSGLVLDERYVPHLRRQLARDPRAVKATEALLEARRERQGAPHALRVHEHLNALACRPDEDPAANAAAHAHALRPLLDAVIGGDADQQVGLARWARGTQQHWPEAARRSTTGRRLRIASELRAPLPNVRVEDWHETSDLDELAPAELPRVPVAVAWTRDGLLFERRDEGVDGAIHLPATEPLQLWAESVAGALPPPVVEPAPGDSASESPESPRAPSLQVAYVTEDQEVAETIGDRLTDRGYRVHLHDHNRYPVFSPFADDAYIMLTSRAFLSSINAQREAANAREQNRTRVLVMLEGLELPDPFDQHDRVAVDSDLETTLRDLVGWLDRSGLYAEGGPGSTSPSEAHRRQRAAAEGRPEALDAEASDAESGRSQSILDLPARGAAFLPVERLAVPSAFAHALLVMDSTANPETQEKLDGWDWGRLDAPVFMTSWARPAAAPLPEATPTSSVLTDMVAKARADLERSYALLVFTDQDQFHPLNHQHIRDFASSGRPVLLARYWDPSGYHPAIMHEASADAAHERMQLPEDWRLLFTAQDVRPENTVLGWVGDVLTRAAADPRPPVVELRTAVGDRFRLTPSTRQANDEQTNPPKIGFVSKAVQRLVLRAEEQVEPGLYRIDGSQLGAPVESIRSERALILTHGIVSSTSATFADLFAQEKLLHQLAEHYRGEVYAYDCHTLSRSPIENALDLVQRLPAGLELHLLTFGIGGLIGELMARGQRVDDAPPFDHLDLEAVHRRGQDAEPLEHLSNLLERKRIGIARYVRIACPATGNRVNYDSLRRLGSPLRRALSWAGGGTATQLMFEVLTSDLDVDALPGLRDTKPGATLIRILNRPDVVSGSDLVVLGGVTHRSGLLSKIRGLTSRLFFEGENDLVVPAESMSGGVPRPKWRFMISGDIDHFSYFQDPQIVGRIATGLTGSLPDRGGGMHYLPFEPQPAPE